MAREWSYECKRMGIDRGKEGVTHEIVTKWQRRLDKSSRLPYFLPSRQEMAPVKVVSDFPPPPTSKLYISSFKSCHIINAIFSCRAGLACCVSRLREICKWTNPLESFSSYYNRHSDYDIQVKLCALSNAHTHIHRHTRT